MVGLVPAQPAQAEPDIDDVQKRVDTLFHEAEQASERLNDAKIELADLRGDLVSLQADQERQDTKLEAARENLQDSIVSQYEGQSLSAVGVVANTDDAELLRLEPVDHVGLQRAAVAALRLASPPRPRPSTSARRRPSSAPPRSRRPQDELAAEKQTIDDKLAEAKDLLDQLKAEEREALLTRGSVRMPSGIDASGRAATAIRYAMAQVGKAYVYGAAGPNAFDCSGLMMMAWAQAGRRAAALLQRPVRHRAAHVASSDLQPGDLVFYYSPISHVAHVHRQRPDRRGGQPGRRRPRLAACSRCRTPARPAWSDPSPAGHRLTHSLAWPVAVRGCSAAP